MMQEVLIEHGALSLPGLLSIPAAARGLVIFAHGSGSSRLSPRNQLVADYLNRSGTATLLFDLLTPVESQDRNNVFDIALLAARLQLATTWVREQPSLVTFKLGYFGASTGAAAALVAAAELGQEIAAVVSRGGRPDLALSRLAEVTAPTLLLVGGLDGQVIELNQKAARQLTHCETIIIPGATHLFEEPGKLEQVCHHASAWFTRYLASIPS